MDQGLACRTNLRACLQTMQYLGLAAGTSLLTLNDVVIDSSAVDIYYLLKMLARQSDVMARLQKAGVPASNVPVFQALRYSLNTACNRCL